MSFASASLPPVAITVAPLPIVLLLRPTTATSKSVGQGGQTQVIPCRIFTGTSTINQSIWVLQPAVPLPEPVLACSGCQSHFNVLELADASDDTGEVYCYETATQNEN